jgi:Endo-alpha-N-acetylgalactosaminidase
MKELPLNSKNRSIERREFVKLGCMGLLSFTTIAREHKSFANTFLPVPAAPISPVVLKSAQLEVVLDREQGLPSSYKFSNSHAVIQGSVLAEKILAIICSLSAWEFRPISVVPVAVRATSTQADFQFHASWSGQTAATFVVRYALSESTIFVTLEDVQEMKGFELIQVELPQLATVLEEQKGAWLAHGETGGSVATLAQAKPGHLAASRFWGDILATLPVVMIGTDDAVCIQETTAYMDGTALAVWTQESGKQAILGATQRYRVNGSLTYDMNADGANGHIAGKPGTPNLLVGQKSSCRLDLLCDREGNRRMDWLAAMKYVRKRMPPIPNPYYHDKFQHDVICDLPRPQAPVCTFAQAADRVAQLAALMDGAPQIARIWGWQYRGKDTGYPAVDKVNPRLGTYEDLMGFKQTAHSYNTLVTLSDNYDDAYKSSPAWDPALVARRPDEELWISQNWTGETSYVLGPAKYMESAGVKRARFTCEYYKVEKAAHIDVVTYYSIRSDWDTKKPASGFKNLTEGRYKLLEIYKEYGVDVSSELIRYPFIGKVSSYHYGVSGGVCPFGGDPIPLQAALYRKSAIWGQESDLLAIAQGIANEIFYNGHGYLWFSEDPSFNVPVDRLAELYYLSHLPWRALHHLDLESFDRKGDLFVLGFENNATAKLNLKTKEYAVELDGVEIARTGTTFCPIDDERIAFYSTAGGELSVDLPKNWDKAKAVAIALAVYPADRTVLPIKGEKNVATLDVPARRPVMLYRHGAEAKARLLVPSAG